MKYRKLRIAWSVAWGIAPFVLIGLTIRSYWIEDAVGRGNFTTSDAILLDQGALTFDSSPTFSSSTSEFIGRRVHRTPVLAR
jgi:hypothetical protein